MKKVNILFLISVFLFLVMGNIFAQMQPENNSSLKINKISGDNPNSGSPVYFFDDFNNLSHPVLSSVHAPDTWYPDRYPPNAFENYNMSGNRVLHHRIDVADALLNRPSGYQSTFYNTQGRDYDLHNGSNTAVGADLYIPTNWQTNHRRADLWASVCDAGGSVVDYPIIGFANTTGSNPTFRVWDESGAGAWVNLSYPITYGQWYSFKIELSGTQFKYYINGTLVITVAVLPGANYFGNMMLQAYNFGDPTLPPENYALESYDVYWDNVGAGLDINLYVSTTTSSPYGSTIYPNISWNTPLTLGSDGFDWTPLAANHDWTYKGKTGTFYIVPVGTLTPKRSFNAATIKLVWNPSIVSGLTVTQGNFFNDGSQPTLFTTNRGSNWVIIDASCLTQNQTPDGSKYIAKLDFEFNGTESGFSPIAIDAETLLYMNGSYEYEVITATSNMGGKLKCYLGDFASTTPSSEDHGDGLITGTDLSGFSLAYWSHYNDPSTLYKSKYDIGPTTPVRYYFGNPTPDGAIGFEDLAIFAMGYSKTGSGTLPDNPKPLIFALDNITRDASGTLRLPVKLSGNVDDVRAFSIKIRHGSDMEYKGVEMAGEMMEGTKFLIGKDESGKAFVDGASFDALATGLSREGTIAYILFNEKTAGNHTASFESVIARNSGNLDLEVNFAGMNAGVGVPTTFNLSQNYPNPFNPVTKIEYALPNDVKVSIKIYDIVGREVSVLVNEMQKAGYYKLDWNGSSLASGAYFYRMVAGDFVAVKKMMLIK